MSPSSRRYLIGYLSQLESCHTPSDVHDRAADWLWHNRRRVSRVARELNQDLKLEGKKRFRGHIPTLAVGALDGTVLFSANPGFNERSNAREEKFRALSRHLNRDFGRYFFKLYPRKVGGNAWWSRALDVSYLIQTGNELRLPVKKRWQWAAAQGSLASGGYAALGNFDLVPFHSTKDGFSTKPARTRTQRALLKIALATLRLALRIEPRPRLLLVASKGGKQLVESNLTQLGLTRRNAEYPPPYGGYLSVYDQRRTGRTLVCFGAQIFANNFTRKLPENFSWTGLAEQLRPLANPPY